MTRSMYSAISGLRAHQTWMDVIGNNIANVNTTGFKVGRVRFQDILSQNMRGASAPGDGFDGTNPIQVGLGAVVGAIDTIQTQGTLQSTGKMSDFAIQGDGFFIVNNGTQNLYTRDGAFDVGADGRIVNTSTGMYVMGWQADANGDIDTASPLGPIVVPLGQQMDAVPSTEILIQGNLNASAADSDAYAPQVVDVVDSQGFSHELTLTLTKTGDNAWSWEYSSDDPDVTLTNATGTLTFDDQGNIDTITPSGDLTAAWGNGAADTVVTGGGDFTRLTQLDSDSTATADADGAIAGSLISFTASENGEIQGLYSNGTLKQLGQIATATFSNPGGLQKMGSNMFTLTPNSGEPVIGAPGTGGHGVVAAGYLEASNVDLAQEFTNMIMAERGFQANSRVITTSDEMMQDVVNLKR